MYMKGDEQSDLVFYVSFWKLEYEWTFRLPSFVLDADSNAKIQLMVWQDQQYGESS